MNSKQRVLMSIRHLDTDRCPLDWWATPEVINKMCDYFSFCTEEEILRKLNVDIRYAGFKIKNTEFERMPDGSFQKKIDNQHFVDIWGVRRKKVNFGKGEYFELEASPLSEANKIKDIENFRFPDISDFSIDTNNLEMSHDYAVVFTGDRLTTRTSFFKLAMYLRGFENFLLDLTINKKIAMAIIERLFEFHYSLNEAIFNSYGKQIDIFLLGDDFGTQTGPLIGPDIFKHFFKEPLKKMIELCHRYEIKTMLHSCGSIKIFIPDLIEIGLDILNPVQHTASGMDMSELKKEFGNYLCFHGAIDVQSVLPFGTRKDIEREVKMCIEILGKNGGYICAPSHNLQPDIPPENIAAMYEIAASYTG